MGFGITYGITNEKVAYIHCDNGKEFENQYLYPSDDDKKEIFKKCDISEYFFNLSNVKGVLTDDERKVLDGTILQLVNKGALESEIQTVVDDYKTKYSVPNPDAGVKYTTEELTKKWGHDLSESFKVGDGNWIANYKIEYKNKYTVIETTLSYVVMFLLVSILFWLLGRIFFYVFVKESFWKLK